LATEIYESLIRKGGGKVMDELSGIPIPDTEKRSRPNLDGPYWYQRPGGTYELVFVTGKGQRVKKFFGHELAVTECRGKFYGPLRPTKYSI